MKNNSASNPAAATASDTIFYDKQCRYCRRMVQKLQVWQRGELAFVAIGEAGADTTAFEAPGRLALLRELHLRTADGNWITGIDAALRVGRHTRLGPLLAPLHWPPLHALSAWLYQRWSLRRYRKLYGCESCRDES